MIRPFRFLPLVPAICLSASAAEVAITNPPLSETMLKGLKARSLGPAVMGGRVSDLALDPRNPFVFYAGISMSGVWKTANNGVTFAPVFDDQPVLSIGAVAVAPTDSEVVWVGTGEGNDRNSSGWATAFTSPPTAAASGGTSA